MNGNKASTSEPKVKLSPLNVKADFLAVILDINPYAWSLQSSSSHQPETNGTSPLKRALDQLRIFLNAHVAQQSGNGVAVWAAGVGKATLLHTSAPQAHLPTSINLDQSIPELISGPNQDSTHTPDANTYQYFSLMDNRVFDGVKAMLQEMVQLADQIDQDDREEEEEEQQQQQQQQDGLRKRRRKIDCRTPTGIVSAISQALCHINRHVTPTSSLSSSNSSIALTSSTSNPTSSSSNSNPKDGSNQKSNAGAIQSRILVLSVTPDSTSQYIPMMNNIFAAQKQNVTIDVLKLFGNDTVFLQQASHLTKGIYFGLEGLEGLLVTLLTTYLPSRSLRPLLELPSNDQVDFRAACFCHQKVVDIGYVCSVCLSIFCQPLDHCLTCKSKFPKKTLSRYRDELSALGENINLH